MTGSRVPVARRGRAPAVGGQGGRPVGRGGLEPICLGGSAPGARLAGGTGPGRVVGAVPVGPQERLWDVLPVPQGWGGDDFLLKLA